MGSAAAKEPLPLDAQAWYAWESDEPESNWLLTYVDMLSVVLAMLVVLLGHLAAQRVQQPAPEETVAVVEQAQPESPVTDLITIPETRPEERLASAVKQRFQGEIKVIERYQCISLEIADVILFDSGKAELLSAAEPVLARLVKTLQEIGDAQVAVEGHTDDRPIHGGRYRSNWELAAARANAVTRYLLSQGFSAKRLRSVSYADTHPVASNGTQEGRAENRRVNLRIEFL
jgi:chemotaxis protein MotB